MSSFKRLWYHLRRAPFQSLAAISVSFFVFLTTSFFLFLMIVSYSVINFFESRPEVIAFLKDDVPREEIDQLMETLKNESSLKDIKYVSKEEALKIYRNLDKDNPLLLEMVTAEVLPSSIEIAAENPDSLNKIMAKLEQKKNLFEEIAFPKDLIDFLVKFVDLTRIIGLIILVFLVLLVLIIIMGVVGMKITLFKSEIEVLKLLGGSGFYIKMPFLLEGMTYGFLGPLLGGGLILGLVLFFKDKLIAFLARLALFSPNFNLFFLSLGIQIVFGILVGLLAALLAVRRRLK